MNLSFVIRFCLSGSPLSHRHFSGNNHSTSFAYTGQLATVNLFTGITSSPGAGLPPGAFVSCVSVSMNLGIQCSTVAWSEILIYCPVGFLACTSGGRRIWNGFQGQKLLNGRRPHDQHRHWCTQKIRRGALPTQQSLFLSHRVAQHSKTIHYHSIVVVLGFLCFKQPLPYVCCKKRFGKSNKVETDFKYFLQCIKVFLTSQCPHLSTFSHSVLFRLPPNYSRQQVFHLFQFFHRGRKVSLKWTPL